jgi:Ca2+-binding EF-hand superfamily protein
MNIGEGQLVNYIEQIFNKYDFDHSGGLDAGELSIFFNDLYKVMGIEERVTIAQGQQALAKMDVDHDGRVSKAELF